MSINRAGFWLLSLHTDTRCILCILVFPVFQVIASKVVTHFLEPVPLPEMERNDMTRIFYLMITLLSKSQCPHPVFRGISDVVILTFTRIHANSILKVVEGKNTSPMYVFHYFASVGAQEQVGKNDNKFKPSSKTGVKHYFIVLSSLYYFCPRCFCWLSFGVDVVLLKWKWKCLR